MADAEEDFTFLSIEYDVTRQFRDSSGNEGQVRGCKTQLGRQLPALLPGGHDIAVTINVHPDVVTIHGSSLF